VMRIFMLIRFRFRPCSPATRPGPGREDKSDEACGTPVVFLLCSLLVGSAFAMITTSASALVYGVIFPFAHLPLADRSDGPLRAPWKYFTP
jgi:hypothetical protein